jgi:hypothetical protein
VPSGASQTESHQTGPVILQIFKYYMGNVFINCLELNYNNYAVKKLRIFVVI